MSSIEWKGRSTPAANAQRELPRMMADYFHEVREALHAKPSPARLHPIRLAGKKVRYTLELFKPCYGEGFDERMEALKDVQTLLGGINDAVAAARIVRGAMPKSAQRKTVLAFLKQRAAEKAKEFRNHWKENFDAPGRENWWTDFLSAPK